MSKVLVFALVALLLCIAIFGPVMPALWAEAVGGMFGVGVGMLGGLFGLVIGVLAAIIGALAAVAAALIAGPVAVIAVLLGLLAVTVVVLLALLIGLLPVLVPLVLIFGVVWAVRRSSSNPDTPALSPPQA
jgi:hypothetical protein